MPFEIRWVEPTEKVRRYFDVKCDGCGSEMEPELPQHVADDGGWKYLQLFPGQYKIEIDNFDHMSGSKAILLCVQCVDQLISLWPIFRVPDPYEDWTDDD